jgi:hypothetical protein
MVLAYRQFTHYDGHVDSVYRSLPRASECLQAKASEKDKIGKGRVNELRRIRLSRVAFKCAT